MNPNEFSIWFKSNSQRLARIEASQAAHEIGARLARVDERLSVEVADIGGGARELIVGASREKSLFRLVEALCAELSDLANWNVQALKPARGFDFELQCGDCVIRASDLRFEPLHTDEMPGELGLRFFAPEDVVPAVSDVAWLMLETGIGERGAADVAHVDVVPLPPEHHDLLSLDALQSYLTWATRRGGPASS